LGCAFRRAWEPGGLEERCAAGPQIPSAAAATPPQYERELRDLGVRPAGRGSPAVWIGAWAGGASSI
jgi:hypothetical protein